MELFYRPEDVEHVARHLFGSEVLGGKFNQKITEAEQVLVTIQTFVQRYPEKLDNLEWTFKPKLNFFRADIFGTADAQLKVDLGISPEEPLGFHAVIKLTDSLRLKVKKEARGNSGSDQIEVNTISGVPPVQTDDFVIELVKFSDDSRACITSVYPGNHEPSPSLPYKDIQTPEEYQENLKYWNDRAFIKF